MTAIRVPLKEALQQARLKCPERKREASRRHYYAHREEKLAYQREYDRTHRAQRYKGTVSE